VSMHASAYPLYTARMGDLVSCMGDPVSCMGDSVSCMGDPVSMYFRARQGSLPLGAATCSACNRLVVID